MKPAALVLLLLLFPSFASCAGLDPNAIDPVTGMSLLAQAIADGDVKKVKSLIKAGADIYAESYSDFIFIKRHTRDFEEDTEYKAVQQLLAAGGKLDLTTYDFLDETSIFLTLDRSEENAGFFDALLKIEESLGGHIEMFIRTDLTNLMITTGKEGFTDKVLSRGREEGYGKDYSNCLLVYRLHSPLKQAIYRQNIEIVKLLLKAAKKDTAGLVNKRYNYFKDGNIRYFDGEYANHSPLSLAMRSGNIEMVKLLLDAGASAADEIVPPDDWPARLKYTLYSKYTIGEYAVILQNIDMLAFLIDYGVNVCFTIDDSNGLLCSPLHRAVELESPEIARLLLSAGTYVDPANDYDGRTPLFEAVKRNNVEIARMLLEAGADPEKLFHIKYRHIYLDNYTPLVWAVKEKNTAMANLLIESGADINFSAGHEQRTGHTPLTMAAVSGDTDMVRLLIDAGADINTIGKYGFGILQSTLENKPGETALELINRGAKVNIEAWMPPLLVAAYNGDVSLMQTLLEMGADVLAKGYDGGTALSLAAGGKADRKTFTEILDLLRGRGFTDVNYSADYGRTALHAAAESLNYDTAGVLIEQGANVNAKDKDRLSPLHYALYKPDTWGAYDEKPDEEKILRMARLLINAGADVNLATPDDTRFNFISQGESLWGSYTHLMRNFGKPRIIEALIKAGADVNARDIYGRTALMFHSWFGNADTVKVLADAGANVNLKNIHGETALMYAAYHQNQQMVKILIAAGADVNARSNNGGVPLMFSYGNKEITRLLIEAGAKGNADAYAELLGAEGIHYSDH